MFGAWFWAFLLFSLPVFTVVFFCISLFRFISGRRRCKQDPGSVSPQNMATRGFLLGVSTVLMVILVLIVVGLIALLSGAIPFM